MKRASYLKGVEWIAINDEPGADDPGLIGGQISIVLLADLFGVPPMKVAIDVVKYRADNHVYCDHDGAYSL